MGRGVSSKFLSLVLRHHPETIGVELDENGWVSIDALLAGCRKNGRDLGRAELDEIVRTNGKQRFAISDDGARIRASQGHSVEVELGYAVAAPPGVLFHGTVSAVLESIRGEGLQRMSRHHVHLSADIETASAVGGRRGRAVILRVRASDMAASGHVFYKSANGVWLTDAVPPLYIDFPDASRAGD